MLSLHLFAAPRLLQDGHPLTLTRRKSRALLYYLAGRGAPVTRDQLLAIFWPDLDRAAAQQTLRTTLHGLRKSLGDTLQIEDGTVALAHDVSVDTRQFEAGLQHARRGEPDAAALSAALDLYQGDFLEGFSLPDSAAFEDWTAAERERLRRLAVGGLATLAGLQAAAGKYPEALATLERALAFDPLQEDLQREALRLHYLAGDRAGAIRRYTHLRQLLDDEMGVLPMAETRAVYDAILTDSLPPALPFAPNLPAGRQTRTEPRLASNAAAPPDSVQVGPVPFAGRAAELAALRAAARTPPASRPVMLLEGEAGLGKSRLAEEFLLSSGSLALSGAARELEQGLPYQPVIEALRGLLAQPAWPALQAGLQSHLPPVWLAEVARLLPELLPASGPPGQSPPRPTTPDEPRLWEGVHQFLRAVARQHALIFFIDDLQWADASTLGLLLYLARRAQADAADIIYLAALRPRPHSPALGAFIQTLTREERLLRLPLAPLQAGEVTGLVAEWTANHAAPAETAGLLSGWVLPASEGNPYILVELLRYACEKGMVQPGRPPDPAALAAAPIVPASIYALIQSRLARLGDPARRVLDAAVPAGREFDFEVVYRAAGLSETAGLDALDELSAAGLVHPLPPIASAPQPPLTRYAFDHSLTMEVAYREAGEPRHRLMHRRVAEALLQVYGRQRLDDIAGLLAFHFAEGNQPERAAPYAFRAGQLAVRVAGWAEAVAFFEQALEAESDPAQRWAITMALGEAHYSAGNMAAASEAFRLALSLARDLGEPAQLEQAQLGLARAQLPQARFDEVRRLARQVAEAAASHASLAAAEFLIAISYSLAGADLASAAEHLALAERELRAAIEHDGLNPGRLAQIKFEQGSLSAQRGDLSAAVALYREAMAIADASPIEADRPYAILARNNLAYHLHLLNPGDPAAQAAAEAGLRLAEEQGQFTMNTWLLSTLGEIALGQGNLDAAEERFKAGLALAERVAMPERIAGFTANLGLVALARGEAALALYRLSTALAQADALGVHHLAAQIRLWLAPLLPPAEGRARLAEARAFAETDHRAYLLKEAAQVERELNTMGDAP